MAESHEYRRKFFLGNFVFLGILILILGAIYGIRDLLSGAKVDMTQDRVYTISDATRQILAGLKDDVTVTYYCSEELPAQLQNLKRDTKDLFDEFHDISNERFQYSIVNPESLADRHAQEAVDAYEAEVKAGKTPKEPQAPQSIEQIFGGRKPPSDDEIRASRDQLATERAAIQQRPKDEVRRELLAAEFKRNYLQKLEQDGVGAFPVEERDASSVRQLRVYSAIEIKYLTKDPEIIQVHYQIESLEYELASRILKMTQAQKPVVAFFDGRRPPAPPMDPSNPTPPPEGDYAGITQALSELFDIRNVSLKEGDSLDDIVVKVKEDAWRKENDKKPEAERAKEFTDKVATPEDLKRYLKCFIVAQPDSLEPRQVYEVNRAVSLGVPTILLTSRFTMDVSQRGMQMGLPINSISSGLDDVLRKWGVELREELLASNESGTVELPTNVGGFMMRMARPLPVCVAATNQSISKESALTNRIPSLVFPASTGLRFLPETLTKSGLAHEVLASTARESWSVKVDPFARLQNPLRKGQGMGTSVAEMKDDLLSKKDPTEFRGFVEPVALAALVQGKFPFTFQGDTVPEWRKEPKEGAGSNPHAGIPGMPNIPGMGPGSFGDEDLRLNADDPQDGATTPGAPAQTATPPVTPGPAEQSPPQTPSSAAPPAPAAGATAAAPSSGADDGKPADAQKPAEAAAEKPKASLEPVEGKLLVLSSVDMLKNDFLMQRSGNYQPNISFFHNTIETFGLGDLLLQIRRKQLTIHDFVPNSDKWSWWITVLNTFGVPLLVGAAGLVGFLLRRADSISYERRHIQRQQGAWGR